MPRIDLFDDMSRLREPSLPLEALALRGIPYGCAASDFPVNLVSQVTLAPIVKSSSWSSEEGASYQDEDGNALSLSEVIANALQFGGVLHLREGISFGFEGRQVRSFAIYGKALDFFRYIKSYSQFVEEFGKADEVATKEAYGDLMGYEHYYAKSKKLVAWDEFGKKLELINFGMKRNAARNA
jgi:hypothetical protein